MLRLLLAWASCLTLATASLQRCTTRKYSGAFLSEVTEGLDPSLKGEFCRSDETHVVVRPEDTGIVHYVLPGSIALDKLGKQNNTFGLLPIGEVAGLASVQAAAALHLWVRATCTG